MKTALTPILTLALLTSVAGAQDLAFEFTPVARVGDAMPGGGTMTATSTDDPAFGEGLLAFEASVSTVNGFFVGDGSSVTRINFTGNTRPDGGLFTSAGGEGVIDGGFVSFERLSGIFLAPLDGLGPITAIADFNTIVRDSAGNPVGGASFTRFADYGRDGSVTAFEGTRTGDIEGLYRDIGGSLRLLLEPGDPSLFGAGLVTALSEPFVREAGVVFNVADDQGVRGIVADFGGGPGVSLEVLVDSNTASPNSLGNFDDFDEVGFDGDLMVFQARTQLGGFGIYMLNLTTDTLSVIADCTVPAPGTAMNFAGGFDPSISGTNVIFNSEVDGVSGQHLWADGTLHKVVQEGDTVLGGTVSLTDNRVPYAIEGDRFGVRLDFSDAPDGYFICEIHPDCNDNDVPDYIDRQECPDIDCDGVVTFLDLWQVIFNFGQTGPNEADVNNDGIVNFWDYLIVAFSQWQFCGW